MIRTMKVLLSARDVGAAGHVRAVVAEFARRPGVEVALHAASPALEHLAGAAVEPVPFRAEAVQRPTPERGAALLSTASDILRREQPDAVVVGLSHSAEAGVDEALLACAPPATHTYVIQDFWGDVNEAFGARADCYFVLDHEAARITGERHGVTCEVVGSAKHGRYFALDPVGLRRSTRRWLGAGVERSVIGYFGQPLFAFDGYPTLITSFGRAVASVAPAATVFYRPHPRESADSVARTVAAFAAAEIDVQVAPEGPVEPWLAAADATFSPYSTCCYDLLWLTRASPEPLGAPCYLLYDGPIRSYARWVNGMDVLPPVAAGLALCAESIGQLEPMVDLALQPRHQAAVWRRARRELPDAIESAHRIVDAVLRDVAVRAAC